ncbi:MAG TPA: hypothetical protein VJ205_00075 [Gammaproteobacteria bacterium]|nr:hypothetical protein [Gammaproteobacteria bacterium]
MNEKIDGIVDEMLELEPFILLTMSDSPKNPLQEFLKEYEEFAEDLKRISSQIKQHLTASLNTRDDQTEMDGYRLAILNMNKTKGYSLQFYLHVNKGLANCLHEVLPEIQAIESSYFYWEQVKKDPRIAQIPDEEECVRDRKTGEIWVTSDLISIDEYFKRFEKLQATLEEDSEDSDEEIQKVRNPWFDDDSSDEESESESDLSKEEDSDDDSNLSLDENSDKDREEEAGIASDMSAHDARNASVSNDKKYTPAFSKDAPCGVTPQSVTKENNVPQRTTRNGPCF